MEEEELTVITKNQIMKKLIIVLSALFFIFSFLIVGFYFVYKNSVITNLSKIETNINNDWNRIYKLSEIRILKIRNTNKLKDSLSYYLDTNIKSRANYQKKYDIKFAKLEHDVNEYIVKNRKEILKENEIVSSNDGLNLIIENYNFYVRQYNIYYSTFPNSLIAKRQGLKRKKYYDLTYGISNMDPYKKEKYIPQWMLDDFKKNGLIK